MVESVTDAVYTTTNTSFSENITSNFQVSANVTESLRFFWDYNIYKTGVWLLRNSWKIVTLPGLLGNLFIIIVTVKMTPFNSSRLFMISLAVVDFLTICFRIPFKTVVPRTTNMICDVMWYMYNALPMFSNYVLLLWTIERFIAVNFPLRLTEWCTIRRTVISVAAVGMFSFAVTVPWPVSIVLNPSGKGCIIDPDKTAFIYEVWYKADTSFFIFVPMVIIFLCNITIIYRLQQSTRRHQQMTNNKDAKQKREKEQRHTTVTLLVTSFAFVVLHTPLAVYNCLAMSMLVIRDSQAKATLRFLNSFGLTMAELQNSINFYLYFLTGRRYRHEMIRLFLPCIKPSSYSYKGTKSIMKMSVVSNKSDSK